MNLRRAGRWKSDSCVDGYLDNSKALREMRMAGIDKMLGGRKPKPDPKPTTPEVSTFSLSQVVPHRLNVDAVARMCDDPNDSDSDGMVLEDLKSRSAKRRKEKRELIKKAIHRYLGKTKKRPIDLSQPDSDDGERPRNLPRRSNVNIIVNLSDVMKAAAEKSVK